MEAFEPEIWLLVVMTLIAVCTGFIDSIAGGGGLIMMPSLLAAGLPPHLALGTNKLQSVFGTTMACRTYASRGLVEWRTYWPLVIVVFLTSLSGAILIQFVTPEALSYVIPFLLLGLAGYIIFSRKMTDEDAHIRLSPKGYAPVAGAIGLYDGVFGPGTGQFFTASLVELRGKGLTRAVANAKLLNATTNWAAVLAFAMGGKMVWVLGLCMAAGAMIGGYLGSHFAMKHGAKVIRPLMIIAVLGLSGKLIYDLLMP